jgi:hypothetical protein
MFEEILELPFIDVSLITIVVTLMHVYSMPLLPIFDPRAIIIIAINIFPGSLSMLHPFPPLPNINLPRKPPKLTISFTESIRIRSVINPV